MCVSVASGISDNSKREKEREIERRREREGGRNREKEDKTGNKRPKRKHSRQKVNLTFLMLTQSCFTNFIKMYEFIMINKCTRTIVLQKLHFVRNNAK